MNSNIIGNIFIILLFAMHTFFGSQIDISTSDMTGRKNTSEFIAGQPFMVHVALRNVASQIQLPNIPGFDAIGAKRTGVHMSSVNGKSSIRYSYMARVDAPGNYTIGPVQIHLNGKDITSNTVNITIAQSSSNSNGQKPNTNNKEPFLECTTTISDVYVGQAVPVQVRFYYPTDFNADITLKKITLPQLASGKLKENTRQPKEGIHIIKQHSYKYVQWDLVIYPEKTEQLLIPAFSVDYEEHDPSASSLFAGFAFMFHGQIKRMYSNSMMLNVSLVPPYNGQDVHIVGQFNTLQASVQPADVNIHDAATFTIRLEGNGNFDLINTIALMNMPAQCKWYDSQTRMIDTSAENKTKEFDYIMQFHEPGTFQIGKQQCIVFDPLEKKHHVLTTDPQKIMVRGSAAIQASTTPIKTASHKQENMNKNNEQNNSLLPPMTEYAPFTLPSMPWFCVWLIMILPIGACLARYMHHNFASSLVSNYHYYFAHRLAKRALRQAEKASNYHLIYPIFAQLIAHKLQISSSMITHEFFEHLFDASQKMNDHHKKEWSLFATRAIEYAFSNAHHHADFFVQAHVWLDRLCAERIS